MKKLFPLFLLGVSSFTFAQDCTVLLQNQEFIEVQHVFSEQNFTKQLTQNSQIDFGRYFEVLSMEKGAPALPVFHTTIQIPEKGNPAIVLDYDSYVDFQQVEVLPSKGNLKRNVDPKAVPYEYGNVYQSNTFYPQIGAKMSAPFVWRSLRGVNIAFSPVQYNPVTKVLRVYSGIKVKVVLNVNESGVNEIAKSHDPVFGAFQQRMILNSTAEKYNPIEEQGEMLVIAGPDLADEIQPLVNWKNQKGIVTTLVTTATTGTTDADIKNYIQNFYTTNPMLIYVLLVGDHNIVPAHTYGVSGGEELWSDSYYGQLAGGENDFHPEAFVGRFSGVSSQIITMVNRTLEYEKNPAPGNWMEKAIGLASEEGASIGDDGQADWQHMRGLRTKLMNFGYDQVYEFYDGSKGGADASGDPSSAVILPALNTGVGLFNYTGHGAQNLCVSGNFTSSSVNVATNNGTYPFVVSVACNNGTFTQGTCISEAWLNSTNAGTAAGAIAAAGSTILMAWAQPMQTQDEIVELITESYTTNHKESIGGIFYNGQLSMLENYPTGDGIEVMQTWVLFGDPSTSFRSKETLPLVCTHPIQWPLGQTIITVNCSVDGALVAISQNNVLLGKAIASGGTATISFPAISSEDYVLVTVTKQNHATYQRSVQIGNGPLDVEENILDALLYPNPAKDLLTIDFNSTINADYLVYDISGKLILSGRLEGNNSYQIGVDQLTAGNYLFQFNTDSGVIQRKINILK